MFEELDDPDGLDANDAFFAGTTRRFDALRRRRTGARIAGGTVCAALLVPSFLGAFVWGRKDSTTRPNGPGVDDTIGETAPSIDTRPLVSVPADTVPAAPGVAENILVVGADDNVCPSPGSPSSQSFGDPSTGGRRTDTIMVVRVDPSTDAAAILSLPRDLYVPIPGRGTGRINSAFTQSDPQLLIDTVWQEFGVPIDHFIQIDFCAFTKLIDAIGGVSIPFPFAVRDTSTGLNVPSAGCASFDGDAALAYVRSRHFEYLDDNTGQWQADPSSDFGRIARQQDFVRRVLSKVAQADLLQPNVISALYTTYRDDLVVDTGLTIAKLIELAGVVRRLTAADMHSYQIEGTGRIVAGASVLVWDKDSPHMNAILDLFRGVAALATPVPAEGANTAQVPAPDVPTSNGPLSAIVPDVSVTC